MKTIFTVYHDMTDAGTHPVVHIRVRFESAAVLGAKNIIAGTPMPVNATALQLANILMVRARLHYALGDLRAAESDVNEALQYFRHAQLPGGIAQAEKQLAYFRALLADQAGE